MQTPSPFRRWLPEALAACGAVLLAVAWGWGTASRSDEPVEASASAADRDAPHTAERAQLRSPRPGQQRDDDQERLEYKPALLQIVTNFKKADANINGIPYPEYVEPGTEPGMVLPAGGPYTVEVTYNGNKKTYTISLNPYEIRYLMVELSGFQGGSPAPTGSRGSGDSADRTRNQNEEGKGRVTVYSKPKGDILLDGSKKGQKTPGTIKVEPGEHDLQVKFNNGQMSESKTVRVRKGSRIKLFFRKSNDDEEGEEKEEEREKETKQ